MRPIKRQLLEDRLSLWQSRLSGKPCFHGGLDSPPLAEHLRILDFALPNLAREGRHEFKTESLVGELSAAVHVYALNGTEAPVLIYHHESGESPVDRTLAKMFPRRNVHGLSIYLIEAPFHSSTEDRRLATTSALNYLAMQAIAVATTERLLQSAMVANAPLRVVAGYGQGGVIANLHHVSYDTADIYVPFMAGAAPAENYLSSIPTAAAACRNPESLRKLLNFEEDWASREHANVFPVLASSDLINRFDVQARSYGKTEIEVWPTAHLAATRNPERLREKILRHIRAASRESAPHGETRPATDRRHARG